MSPRKKEAQDDHQVRRAAISADIEAAAQIADHHSKELGVAAMRVEEIALEQRVVSGVRCEADDERVEIEFNEFGAACERDHRTQTGVRCNGTALLLSRRDTSWQLGNLRNNKFLLRPVLSDHEDIRPRLDNRRELVVFVVAHQMMIVIRNSTYC